MFYLDESGGMSQRELGNHMSIKDSTVARLLDRMERDGLIERHRADLDRRISAVVLSEKGKQVWHLVKPEGERFNDLIMKGICPEDQETFDRVLSQMVRNASDDTSDVLE